MRGPMGTAFPLQKVAKRRLRFIEVMFGTDRVSICRRTGSLERGTMDKELLKDYFEKSR